MELLKCQLCVEAHDDAFYFVQVFGNGEALPPQLSFQRFGAADIQLLTFVMLVKVVGGGLGGGHKVLPGGGNAQLS